MRIVVRSRITADTSDSLNLFLPSSLRLVLLFFLGCEAKDHGLLGQPGSEVPVHASLRRALF